MQWMESLVLEQRLPDICIILYAISFVFLEIMGEHFLRLYLLMIYIIRDTLVDDRHGCLIIFALPIDNSQNRIKRYTIFIYDRFQLFNGQKMFKDRIKLPMDKIEYPDLVTRIDRLLKREPE